MTTERIAEVAVLIVGFRNPADLTSCLAALCATAVEPNFDVFICENGGARSYQRLLQELLDAQGPCQESDEQTISATMNFTPFVDIRRLRLRTRRHQMCGSDAQPRTWDMPVGSMPGFVNYSLSPAGKEFGFSIPIRSRKPTP